MKKIVAVVIVALVVGGAATFWMVNYLQEAQLLDLNARLLVTEKELSVTKNDLLGYTKFTDYLSVSKTAMAGQMKFVGAKVDREYVQIVQIQKTILGIEANATILVNYKVEYSFGYDLKSSNFDVSGDKNSITVTLSKPAPILVASPAVNILSSQIPGSSIFINGNAAVINLQQQLFSIAKKRAVALQSDEAVRVLCENNLTAFLRDFLLKQPGVSSVPIIKIAYK